MPQNNLPSGVADRELSIFENAYGKKSFTTTLSKILKSIAGGRWKSKITGLREILQAHGDEAYNNAKKKLPAVTVSGSFRGRSELVQHSGLLQVDLDNIPENVSAIRDMLAKDPHVCAAFVSPSGNGVKAVAMIPACHHDSFLTIEAYFKEKYHLTIDQSTKDVNRLCFVSWDPELRTNPDAVNIVVNALSNGDVESDQGQYLFNFSAIDPCSRGPWHPAEPKVIQSALEGIDCAASDDYAECVAIGQALKAGVIREGLPEGEGRRLFHRFCSKSTKYTYEWVDETWGTCKGGEDRPRSDHQQG